MILEATLESVYAWFKNWHFGAGKFICNPFEPMLPISIAPHCSRFVDGFFTTFELVTLALIFAFLLARILAQMLTLGPSWIRRPISIYVYSFQGTPILIQLWLTYYGLAQFEAVRNSMAWIVLNSGWWVGLFVLILNSAAYQTNIIIGAIKNLPSGQLEGGQSVGLSKKHIFRLILGPQALRASWPALANEGILLLKASALVSTITVLDLMGHARTVFSRSYDLWVYGSAAFLYIVLTAVMTLIAFLIRRYCFTSIPSDPWFKEFIR